MRKFMLSIGFSISLLAGSATMAGDALLPADAATADHPIAGPAESRRAVVAALRANDVAALILAVHGEQELADFLTGGKGETRASIDRKIADESNSSSDQELLRFWATLATADGVNRVSAELFPLWQAQLPQVLAGAQVAVSGIGAAVAENKSMGAVERSQLIELQWALTGWLSRTDFADRKDFDEVLGLARAWIVASGAKHPLELQLIPPEQRLKLADQAIGSLKRALGLYGFDADAILSSVRFEEISRDDQHVRLRTSFAMFGVPLVFEEDLAWFEGQWTDAQQVAAMQAPLDEVPPVDAADAATEGDAAD